MYLKKLFGKKLKVIREAKGITQEKLAELIEMQPTTIAQIETGYRAPSFNTIEKLVNALEIDYQDLFAYKEVKTNAGLTKDIIELTQNFNSETLKIALSILEYFKNHGASNK